MHMNARDMYKGLLEPAHLDDETESRILDTAVEVFTEFGFKRSTMEDVARRAGLSRVTIYRRFQDKDALVQAVILRESRTSLRAIIQEISALKTTEDRFVRGFVSTVSMARRHPLLSKLISGEHEIVLPMSVRLSASQAIDLGRDYMAGIIIDLQKHGKFPGHDPEWMAEMLIRLWHSIVLTPSSKLAGKDEATVTKFVQGFLYPLLSIKKVRSLK